MSQTKLGVDAAGRAAESRVPIWKKIREAAEAGALTSSGIRNWVLTRYPGTNPNSVNTQILFCTVNVQARVNGPENQRERQAPNYMDILYKTGRGEYELYDPDRHGAWPIVKSDNGRFVVLGPSQKTVLDESTIDLYEVPSTSTARGASPGMFAAETHLRDFLASNLDVIEHGLQPFVDEHGNGHVEFRTDVGVIDIICLDRNEDIVVIELKVDRSSDSVAGQILRYVNWVRRHVANGKKVRGIIIAKDISDRLLYSIDSDPTIEAREYEMQVTLKPPTRALG